MACAIWSLSPEFPPSSSDFKHSSSPSTSSHPPFCSSTSPSSGMSQHLLEAISEVAVLPIFAPLLSPLSFSFFLCNHQLLYRLPTVFQPTKLLPFSQKLQNSKFLKFPDPLFLQA